MTLRWFLLPTVLTLLNLQGCRSVSSQPSERAQELVDDLQRHYEDFAFSLNPQRFKEGYPALLEKLNTMDRNKRITALRTIGQSGETDAIPLVVDVVLNERDRTIRIWAGSALKKIVTANELKRRDPERPEKVVLLPRSRHDIDLRPLAWVLREMLAKPDDGNTHAYAATMIGYLDLKQFEPDLRALLESRHPAVTRSAVYALRMMEFEVQNEPHSIKPEDHILFERARKRATQK